MQKQLYTQPQQLLIMLGNTLQAAKDLWTNHKYKILAAVSFMAAGYYVSKLLEEGGETKWSSFEEALRQDKVREVVVDGNFAFFRSQSSEWFNTYMSAFESAKIWNLVEDKNIIFSEKEELFPKQVLPVLGTCVMSILAFKYLMGSLNKKDFTPIDLKGSLVDNQTLLDDYYGGEEIKLKFKETIDFLRDPSKYEEMGARIRRGILFYGPPGTGKTMLARALATEAGCHFIRVAASEFQELYVGVGPKRIRELFRTARRFQQGCIIFIDEIDALGSRANHLRDSHETTTTINQFLNQMDGFTPTEKTVVVAATNRLDLVDQAVLRAGRFDVKVHVALPGYEQRKGILWKILDKKLGKLHCVQQNMVNFISESSENWCGADLQSLVNETIYRAISQKSVQVENQHLLEAYQEMQILRG